MKKIEVPSWLLITYIVCMVLMLVIFYLANQDGNKCISNPMVYGAEKASSEVTGYISCSCSFSNPEYVPFHFTSDGMYYMDELS